MTTTRERILQKLNPKLLKMTPKLSAENGSFINLDSDDSLKQGAKELMMRFWRNQDLCEKNKQNPSQSEVEVTVTSTRYNEGNEICEVLSERLKLLQSNNDIDLNDKPGKNLQKLKLQLQEKMSAKWEEEYKKRVEKNKFNKGYKESNYRHKYLDEKSTSTEGFDSNNCSDDEEDKQESCEDDGCEGDVEDEEEDAVKNDVASFTEADDELGAKENSANLARFEDTESCSLLPAYQPGGGLLYGGSELTQCDEGLPQNLFSPSLRLTGSESSQSRSFSELTPNKKETSAVDDNLFFVRSKLFSQNLNDSCDLNEAYELCSGKFPDECFSSQLRTDHSKRGEAEVDNNEDEEVDGGNEDEEVDGNKDEDVDENEDEEELDESNDEEDVDNNEDELNDGCGESEDEVDSKPGKGQRVRKNIIKFDDSEDEEGSNQLEVETFGDTSKILSDDEENDKMIKRKKKLQFSDEESEGEGDEKEKAEKGIEKEEEEEEEEGNSEKEEEEGNSEKEEEVDEKDDERSVHYDSEENEIINPREFFDKEAELSGSEWSVDEDERGLDEFDMEEGDADNLDNDQVRSQLGKIHLRRVLDEDAREVRLLQEIFFEDGDLHSDGKGRDRKFRWKNLGKAFDENESTENKEEGGHSSEEEGPEEEQQRKLRHEKELFLMEKNKNGDENSGDEIIEDFQCIKVTSIRNSAKVSGTENFKTTLDYTDVQKNVTLLKARGSFLTRDEKFLSKLAKVTSSISDNVLGPKHSKNFVFATKSPEKEEANRPAACKRQVEDAEISGRRHEKKFKCLPPDVDTGPSILDLLV